MSEEREIRSFQQVVSFAKKRVEGEVGKKESDSRGNPAKSLSIHLCWGVESASLDVSGLDTSDLFENLEDPWESLSKENVSVFRRLAID